MNYPLRRAWWFALSWLLAGTTAHAHDALQSSTDIWLRPGAMEVDLTLSRVPSRSLADNPPPTPVTVDNFEALYHSLLQKNAGSLFQITLNGQPLPPFSAGVALSGETDLQFTLIYPRPYVGQFSITASFINRMEDGYLNVLSLNEDQKVLGSHIQKAEDLTWKINLDSNAPPAKSESSYSYFVVYHIYPLVLAGGLLLIIILLAIWRIRRKSKS